MEQYSEKKIRSRKIEENLFWTEKVFRILQNPWIWTNNKIVNKISSQYIHPNWSHTTKYQQKLVKCGLFSTGSSNQEMIFLQ